MERPNPAGEKTVLGRNLRRSGKARASGSGMRGAVAATDDLQRRAERGWVHPALGVRLRHHSGRDRAGTLEVAGAEQGVTPDHPRPRVGRAPGALDVRQGLGPVRGLDRGGRQRQAQVGVVVAGDLRERGGADVEGGRDVPGLGQHPEPVARDQG